MVKQDASLDTTEIITALQTYIESTNDAKTLVQPAIQLFTDTPVLEHAEEVFQRHSNMFALLTVAFTVA